MESDDDTFIVIVGDAVDQSLIASIDRTESPTKHDTICQDIEPVYVDSNYEDSIMEDQDDEDNITLNEELSTNKYSDTEYTPDNGISSNCSDDIVLKKRCRMVKSYQRHSYVQSMKDNYPELRRNKKLLIKSLVAIMKETKPPSPPTDYYVMDGIMLKCIICGHDSVSIPAASRHYQEKHGQRYLYCFACGVNFRSKTNLYKHEKQCKAPDAVTVLKARAEFLGAKGRSRPFLPKKSKKKNKAEKKWKKTCKRRRDEAGEEIVIGMMALLFRYACSQCSARYACSQCSARFVSSSSLTAHTHMHTGTRPYVCGICCRGYTCSTTLLRHLKKHNENELYVCDHCQRSFNVKAAIAAHMDTHKPLRRYACNECPRRFAQRANLMLHVHREHRGLPPPFACRLCPNRYPRMSVLREHMMKEHGLQLMTRKMFFKALPTLSNGYVDRAKIVMESELFEDSYYSLENCDLT